MYNKCVVATVMREMFGRRFGFGLSGEVFAPSPQHVTARTDCHDIACTILRICMFSVVI